MKPLTLAELKEKLSEYDEISLLELMNITSYDLVQAFEYRIEARFEQLEKDVEENE